MSRHRQPTPKQVWHQHRHALKHFIHHARLWISEQRQELRDIITELKHR